MEMDVAWAEPEFEGIDLGDARRNRRGRRGQVSNMNPLNLQGGSSELRSNGDAAAAFATGTCESATCWQSIGSSF